jgi:hypothetical protein
MGCYEPDDGIATCNKRLLRGGLLETGRLPRAIGHSAQGPREVVVWCSRYSPPEELAIGANPPTRMCRAREVRTDRGGSADHAERDPYCAGHGRGPGEMQARERLAPGRLAARGLRDRCGGVKEQRPVLVANLMRWAFDCAAGMLTSEERDRLEAVL